MNLNSGSEPKERFLFSALSYEEDLVLPNFTEQPHKDWIKYGENNMFADELCELFNKSGIHNAIIESKVRMMVGDGIVQDLAEYEYSERTQKFIDYTNPYENMTEIYKKCAFDFELYGLAYLEVIWGKGHKQIAELYHVDATKIRWGKREKGRVKTYFYSQDWSNYRKDNYKPIEIPIFDQDTSAPRQIIPIVRYTPGLNYYAFPDYIAGTKWIKIDTEIANFHFNNLKNGMSPSIFFGFPVGETTNEEREMIERKIKEKYTGTNNSSKFILAFYDAEGDKKPEIQILEQSNADKQFDLLNRTTLQQILIAHKVNNENLVGIATPGKLGSSSEVLQNYELYFNTVVYPEQQVVLDSFKKIMLINGFNDIQIINNKPINNDFTEGIMKEILTRDEMREIIGYEPLEGVDDTISEDQIIEDESGVTVQNQRWTYDFQGVRSINAGNAKSVVGSAGLKDMYIWRLTKSEKQNCPSCVKFNGKAHTLEYWLKTAIPGTPTGHNFGNGRVASYPHSPYGTYCEDKCGCKLVKVGRTK